MPDDTIRAACGTGHPDPAKLLGSQPENHISRFSFKPFVGTVPDFVDAALLGECSITTPIDKATDGDEYPDPEVDREFVETLAAFVRGLQPPPRNGSDAAGEAVFHQLGCATCHVPDMPPALGVFTPACTTWARCSPTAPLTTPPSRTNSAPRRWGLRWRKVYLHDGRADSLHDAIVAHAGEAQTAADAYQAAPEAQRAALFRFLDTL
ncbi:MAG: di-heme oxidoredictase family protein [Candidatus Binatia bacterium]